MYIENAKADGNIDEDINKTIELLKENWETVLLVAQHLEKNKTITYDEVTKIVNIS